MSDSLEKAKIKKRNRNRFIVLLLIYFMFISLFASITLSNDIFGEGNTGRIIALIILACFTILYWIIFYIIVRRTNQKGKK